jgi:hypothetical protein
VNELEREKNEDFLFELKFKISLKSFPSPSFLNPLMRFTIYIPSFLLTPSHGERVLNNRRKIHKQNVGEDIKK